MYRPKRIIDSHIHLITAGIHQAKLEWLSKLDPEILRAYHERWKKNLSTQNEAHPEPSPADVTVVAARWEKELDRVGVEKAVFFPSVESHDDLSRFISLKPERFIGYTTFDPTEVGNSDLLKKHIRDHGVKGLKLYPMARRFHVNDPACFGIYEQCQENGLPVIIHFGISINAAHDLSYGNPLDLSTPALRFPSVKWIIPHFGAGLYREALLVAAQYGNVFIDTSSSNSWINYSPERLTLEDLFRRTYEALGSKRIVFGTDSSFFPRGYRENILEKQLTICNELGLSESEIDDIFHRNIEEMLEA